LNILPLAGVRDEMDARIRELRPSADSTAVVGDPPATSISTAI
jgi:hypothetical protein